MKLTKCHCGGDHEQKIIFPIREVTLEELRQMYPVLNRRLTV